MRYLLDTNIVSDLVRNPQGKIAEQILKVGETKVFTSIIVAAELRYGAEKKQCSGSSRERVVGERKGGGVCEKRERREPTPRLPQ